MLTNGLSSYLSQGFAPQIFGLGGPGLEFGQQGIAQQNPLTALAGAPPIVQQLALTLGQLAQQAVIQGAITQQIGATLHQIVQQVALHSLYARMGQSAPGIAGNTGAFGQYPGAFSPYPFMQSSGQGPLGQNLFGQNLFGQNPFTGAQQGSFAGLQPQGQTWAAGGRPGIQ